MEIDGMNNFADENANSPVNEVTENGLNDNLPPKSWLLESIVATLFCCLPLGVVGIVNAAQVESRFYNGEKERAKRLSAEAKKWTVLSFWIGLIFGALYLIFVVFMGFFPFAKFY